MSGVSVLVALTVGILVFQRIYSEETILKKPEIHSLHIYSDIRYRYATTTVTSRIKNVDTKSREAEFDVTLPNEAFITNLTLEIDGKIINGEIKEKETAKKQYEAAQQRGESAGYIGTRHRETNRFNLAVTVAPMSKVSFNLTYQELLKRKNGYYEQVIYIDPGQPVPDMVITVVIEESREITDVRVPPLRNDVMANIKDLSTVTFISQPTPKTANVKFVPSIEFQTAQSASGMAGQFVIQYDVEREMDLGDVLVVNGYFVHFFAPEGFRPIPKDVLFILDTSGSMTGTKLNQLKQAMKSILTQLNEGDRINIMSFTGSTSFWRTEMVHVTHDDILQEAITHIDSLKAAGWTNIELALVMGVTFLNDRIHIQGTVRSPVIVFLTDGEATSGVTNTDDILRNLRNANELEIPIFSLAFGKYADYDIVKKISIQNNGLGRKIYEASDAAMQIAGFYKEISVTLLNNITFQYLDVPVANVTKHEFTNYFNGTEVVICGRVNEVNDMDTNNSMTLRVTSSSVDVPGLVLSGPLSDILIDIGNKNESEDSGNRIFEEITEKVWAYLTIKQLLDKELATSDTEEKQAYNRQILDMSIKYGFVTPLTSMVVTLPESTTSTNTNENGNVRNEKRQRRPPTNFGNRRYFHPAGPTSMQRGGIQYSDTAGVIASKTIPDYDDLASYSTSYAQSPQLVSHSVGNGVKRRVRLPNKFSKNKAKRRRGKKNKKKNNMKNKSKGFQYPLRVIFSNLKDPICFNMFDDALETGPEMFSFYSDQKTGLKVEVKLEKTKLGKWTKQGSVKEINLTFGDIHEQITSDSIQSNNFSTNSAAPWNISLTQTGKTAELEVGLEAFTLIITPTGNGYLNILAKRTMVPTTLSDTDILGQVFGTKVKVVKTITKPGKTNKKGKQKPAKEMVILKVGKLKKFGLLKKSVVHSTSEDTAKCFPLNKHEINIVDITLAKIP